MYRSTFATAGFVALSAAAFADPPFDTNLIANPGAQGGPSSGSGAVPVPIPGWQVNGDLTVASYGQPGLPSASSPGSPARDTQFFIGGPGPVTTPSASQTIDVAAASFEIDRGRVDFALSGYLGGVAGEDDTALVAVVFNDAAGESLGTAAIIGPTNAARGNQTGMLLRQRLGDLPAGTRSITVILSMSRASADLNEGCADDLSFVISLGLCPADWNQDTGVDGDDIIAFFADWDANNGDFNEDGGSDGDDVIEFFARWDANC